MHEAIVIREAAVADLEVILHHRWAMFHEMGHTDTAGLDEMLAAARAYYAQGLRDGSYRGWLALDAGRRVSVEAASDWSHGRRIPSILIRSALLSSMCIRSPQRAGAEWPAG